MLYKYFCEILFKILLDKVSDCYDFDILKASFQ